MPQLKGCTLTTGILDMPGDISETLRFYSLFICSPKEKVIEGNVTNWEGEARADQLFLFWAAFSQLLPRLSEGQAQNFFQSGEKEGVGS